MENFINDLLKIFFFFLNLPWSVYRISYSFLSGIVESGPSLNIQTEVEKNKQMRGHTTICHVKAGADKHLNNFHTSQSYIFMSSSTSSSCFKDDHQSEEECLMKTLKAMILRNKKQLILHRIKSFDCHICENNIHNYKDSDDDDENIPETKEAIK